MAHEWKLMCKHCGKSRVSIRMEALSKSRPLPIGRDPDEIDCPARYDGQHHEFIKRAVRYS